MSSVTAPQPAVAAVVWVEVAPSFWSARSASGFVGTIDATGAGFTARDARGVVISCAPTLPEAQYAVERPAGTAYRRRLLITRLRHRTSDLPRRLHLTVRTPLRALSRLHPERIAP